MNHWIHNDSDDPVPQVPPTLNHCNGVECSWRKGGAAGWVSGFVWILHPRVLTKRARLSLLGRLERSFEQCLRGLYASLAIPIPTCRWREAYRWRHARTVENTIWLEFSDSMRKRMTSWTERTLLANEGCSQFDIHFRCRSSLQRRRSGPDEGVERGVRNFSSEQCLIDRPTSSALEP